MYYIWYIATLTQLAERRSRKADVTGSIPVGGFLKRINPGNSQSIL